MNKFSKALAKKKQEEEQNRLKQEVAAAAKKAENISIDEEVRVTSGKNAETAKNSTVAHIAKNSEVTPFILALHDPKSNISEQYRTLRTNIKSMNKKVQTILVTSSVEGEGKTVTSLNLAYTFSHDQSKKVLLVDADLRRSKIKSYLGMKKKTHGFFDILTKDLDYRDSLIKTESDNLDIIAGSHLERNVVNAAELLEGKTMNKFVSRVKENYDYIIFDAPPVLPVTDPTIIASYADVTLLVFRAGKTARNTIKHAENIFKQAKVDVAGYVMTAVDYISPGNKDYYYAGYRYY